MQNYPACKELTENRKKCTSYIDNRQTLMWKTLITPTEDSSQPVHQRNQIRTFTVRTNKLCNLGYPKCAWWRCWSVCTNSQDDLNRRWPPVAKGTFSDVVAQTHIYLTITQSAFYVNLYRAVIGPSGYRTGRWRPDVDLRRMLAG